jgi:hydroxymethylpyrimidine pyrophosphatase-like HAD family hydrolase
MNDTSGWNDKALPELAVFDIDGTITSPHQNYIPQEVLDGIASLQSKGVVTTICTGRPFVRMREALGDAYDKVISDDAMISVEHGAKLVNKQGEVITQSAFSPLDIDKLVEFTGLNLDMVQFLAYNPGDLSRKTQIWCPEPNDVAKTREERDRYADVFSGTLIDVKRRLLEQPICNVTLKLKSHIHVENLKIEFTGSSIKAVFQDSALEYMKSKVSKARAITYMCRHLGIYEHHLLVAGNAINDVDMLNMEAEYRVLVGPEGPARETILGYIYDKERLVYMNTPEDLGHYLQSL